MRAVAFLAAVAVMALCMSKSVQGDNGEEEDFGAPVDGPLGTEHMPHVDNPTNTTQPQPIAAGRREVSEDERDDRSDAAPVLQEPPL